MNTLVIAYSWLILLRLLWAFIRSKTEKNYISDEKYDEIMMRIEYFMDEKDKKTEIDSMIDSHLKWKINDGELNGFISLINERYAKK
jgi:hypothetical protein